MTGRRTKRDPHSWTTVRLPERDMGDAVLDLAAPLLERLGSVPDIEDARRTIALAVTFWNASVLASKRWLHPSTKELRELQRRMRGRQASRDDAAAFALLSERWREHWLDPRLVETWTYAPDPPDGRRLQCTMSLPDGVVAEQPPPAHLRVSIGGKFLDEVRISLGVNSLIGFPVEQHRGVIGEDGSATVYAMMPAALQLFAEGRLPPVGGEVAVAIAGRELGAMRLARVSCGGGLRHDVAVLVFEPAGGGRDVEGVRRDGMM